MFSFAIVASSKETDGVEAPQVTALEGEDVTPSRSLR